MRNDTLEVQLLNRELEQLRDTVADMERHLAQWECFMRADQIRECEFEIETMEAEILDLETELCRLEDRTFYELLMDGDAVTSREWEEDDGEEYRFGVFELEAAFY